MSAVEDQMTADARANVSELLELRGRPISLVPVSGTVVEKPGGGKDYLPAAPRGDQVFAVFNANQGSGRGRQSSPDSGQSSDGDGGRIRVFEFDLIGAYDAEVEVGDTWEDSAVSYEITSVDVTAAYQVRCSAVGFLKDPGHGLG